MDWFKDYFSPVISLIFSTFAFLFTLKNEKTKKFNIDVDFLDEKISEYLVDRDSNDEPDVYHQDKFRLIPMVSITNNSSYPITITELTLNNRHKFAFYTKVGDTYSTTYQSSIKKAGAITFYSATPHEIIKVDDVTQNLLQPPFTIEPFQSKTGLIFFHYDSSLIGQNKLSFKTSRGVKEFPLQISSQYISQKISDYTPPPPHR